MTIEERDRELNILLEYLDSECIGTEAGRHGFNYDKAEKAVKQYAAKERLNEVRRMPNSAYIGHGGIRRELNEQYKMDRTRELEAQLSHTQEEKE